MFDGQSFEAMLCVDGAPEDADHRIDRFGGSSPEVFDIVTTNVDFGGRLSFAIEDPVYEIDKLNKSIAYLVPVEFDCACFYVLGPIGDDVGLIRHREEGDIVDREQELIIGLVVVDLDFPLEFLVEQSNGKHARSGEFFATENIQNIRIRGGLRR